MKDVEGDDWDSSGSGRAAFGTLCLYASAAILFLAMIDSSSSLSFMPQSWYTHRWAWYLGAVVGFFTSILLLKSRQPSDALHGAVHRAPIERVVLYTRQGCHLCDEARKSLAGFQDELPEVEVVDIDSDDELKERFDACVPVVEIDGEVRFRGRVNEILLRRFIDAGRESADETIEPSA